MRIVAKNRMQVQTMEDRNCLKNVGLSALPPVDNYLFWTWSATFLPTFKGTK
jgi:hypothetical protein